MPKLTVLQQEILLACSADEVGLWEAVWHAKREFPNANPSEVKRETLSSLQALLSAGLIRAGLPRVDSSTFVFEPWNLPVEQITQRIREEWDQLGHEPDLGDIVWFISTVEGDRALAQGKERNAVNESEENGSGTSKS